MPALIQKWKDINAYCFKYDQLFTKLPKLHSLLSNTYRFLRSMQNCHCKNCLQSEISLSWLRQTNSYIDSRWPDLWTSKYQYDLQTDVYSIRLYRRHLSKKILTLIQFTIWNYKARAIWHYNYFKIWNVKKNIPYRLD